ncbi:alpha/beta hydrolase [Marinactinospora rubrisoli]|uniref:Alpha/beta hydrolase n=1 Tax=Marinactinospora rubrisoli TaxID=2715399 RepID=A0ABW2KP88_9ACTN
MSGARTWAVRTAGPWLTLHGACRDVRAVVLLVHGGLENSTGGTWMWEPAVLRMVPFAWALARAGRGRGLAVLRLRLRVRGWNAAADPVVDVRAALGDVRRRFGAVPVVLAGHSLGGRAVVRAAGEDGVRGVLGLAPWLPRGEPVAQLRGRHLLVANGVFDLHTPPAEARAYLRRARAVAASASYLPVDLDGHPMLRVRRWNAVAVAFTGAVLGWRDAFPGGARRFAPFHRRH